MTSAGLTNHRGRILFTDNFYTSMALATHMWNKYGWTICGTITLTDKKSRQDYDVPFVKMSKGALNMVPRGWFREAVWRYLLPAPRRNFGYRLLLGVIRNKYHSFILIRWGTVVTTQ